MQSFDIIKQSSISDSFRAKAIQGMYDIQNEKLTERFCGNIDLDFNWNIGLIVGNSGTGKSTIAKELFPENYTNTFQWHDNCILDDFPEHMTTSDIAEILTSVGFSSAPSWLKKYSVLSTGEQMRVNLARVMSENESLIVFDEFTSVVDRNIAKIGSYAIQKSIRKKQKQFIAISCHYDIIEWLEPDCVLNTNDMTFEKVHLRRPQIILQIYKQKGDWNLFRKYHYLDSDINNASDQYLICYNDLPCAFIAVIHNPNKIRNLKRIHRLVVLPDFQGVGIGHAVLNYICQKYTDNGFIISITSSNPAIKYMLKSDNKWILTGQGKHGRHGKDMANRESVKYLATMTSRNMFSFKYCNKKLADDVFLERNGVKMGYSELSV